MCWSSPQGLAAKEHAYQNIHQSGYLIGEVDWETLTFKETSAFRELDYGFDFYAPQTFEDEQKRRILWGWMGLGDTSPEYSNPTIPRGWQHAWRCQDSFLSKMTSCINNLCQNLKIARQASQP